MEAKQIKFLDILGKEKSQFIVPVFQRVYSWSTTQCADLSHDMVDAAKQGKEHFLGTFLYSPETDSWGGIERLQIIDGQQRITTITLMLLALAQHLQEKKLILDDGTDADSIFRDYLFTDKKQEAKLLLTSVDREMLEYLTGATLEPEDTASRLKECLEFFLAELNSASIDLNMYWKGLNSLSIISIELSGEDEPQLVFESLNSKGKRLAIDDLVRNALLMHVEQSESNPESAGHYALYRNVWESMEDVVSEFEKFGLDDVIMCWLADKNRDACVKSEDEIFTIFRKTLAESYGGSYEALLSNLGSYCFLIVKDKQKRIEAMKFAELWRAGKPRKIISEMKLFGD